MLTVGSRNRIAEPGFHRPSSGARISVLVRERPGGAALCKSFSHVEPAEAFIQGRLNRQAKQGFLVFWTLPGQPVTDEDGLDERAEVTVLVADKQSSDMVRHFTFADLKTARAFVNEKYADRDVGITWSLPITVYRDERGTVALSPSAPPNTGPAELNATFETDVHEALSFAEAGASDRPEDVPSTLVSEVCKVLAVKRWEFVPGKFGGFHSPPGRF
jgi:hypothetical protein